MTDKRVQDRRRVTLAMHIRMLLIQIVGMIGGVLVGTILVSSVIFDERTFWKHVSDFWGWL